jgi:DTW domain-containing protein YfiP
VAQECPIQLVILRHTLESKRNSNTGRLVAAALAGTRVLEYGSPTEPWDSSPLQQADTWLLYPKPGASVPQSLPKQLVILDGSWSQARRMSQRIPALWKMPTLALPPPATPLPRLRTGQGLQQMSTAESVVSALRLLGQDQPAHHLETLLRELVRRFALPQRRGVQEPKNPGRSGAALC